MKPHHAFILAAVLGFTVSLGAAEKAVAGPKGGRLLETAPQKTEFLVNQERKVEIRFYDASLKPVARAAQVVAVTAEPKAGRTALELEPTAAGFVSKGELPEGDPYRVVVQVREHAGAKPKNFRIELDLAECGECKLGEYACICSH